MLPPSVQKEYRVRVFGSEVGSLKVGDAINAKAIGKAVCMGSECLAVLFTPSSWAPAPCRPARLLQ